MVTPFLMRYSGAMQNKAGKPPASIHGGAGHPATTSL